MKAEFNISFQRFKNVFAGITMLAFAFVLTPVVEGQTTVDLNPNTINEVGGYTEVQELFTIMTANMDSKVKPYFRDAKVTGIRNIINWQPTAGDASGPKEYGYYYPSWGTYKQDPERCFDTKQESYNWFDNFIVKDPQPIWDDLLGGLDYMDSDAYGPVNVTLCGNPRLFDGRLERDIPNAIEHVNAWIQAIKNTKPAGSNAKLKYFQLSNEPEQLASWAGEFGDQLEASKSYVRVFNAIYDGIKAAHPDVMPVLNCVGHNAYYDINGVHNPEPGREDLNWYTWVKYPIDSINSLEALGYLNSQLYSVPTLRNLAYTSMTQSYAEKARGVRPRMVITETGDPSNFKSQFIYHADNIFVMLQNPDKFAMRTGYVASESGTHAIFNIVDGEVVPQSPYYVYYTLRNMRGTNLNFDINNNNLDTDIVKSFAAAPSYNKVVVGLFNPTDQNQTVTLNSGLAEGDISDITHRKAVWNSSISNCDYSEGSMIVESGIELTLEPVSIHAIEIDLDNPLFPDETIHTNEYYGSKTIANMDDGVDYTIDIPAVPDAGSEVLLRVVINRRPDSGDDYQIQINGNNYTYNLGDLPQKIIDGWEYMSGFIEIPVDIDHLQLSNNMTLDPLSDFTLLYASMVIKDGQSVPTPIESDTILSLNGPGAVSIDNTYNPQIQYLASTDRDIIVTLQEAGTDLNDDGDNYTVFGRTKVDVSAGSGILEPAVTIDMNAPVPGEIVWQAFITTDGGSLEDTLHLLQQESKITPEADAGSDQTVIDSDDSGSEPVTLDGSSSFDADGTISSYEWSDGESQIATGVNPTVELDTGMHTITLTVTNDNDYTDSDNVIIIVKKYREQLAYTTQNIPGTIEAEDYDEGGQYVAYYDTSAGNNGEEYRSDDVDIQICDAGGYNVGWIADGEWLEYTISSVTEGTYDITLYFASNNDDLSDPELTIILNGSTLGKFNPVYTDGWQTWQTATIKDVSITGGSDQILRFDFTNGQFNVDKIDFTVASDNAAPVADAGPDQTVTDSDDSGNEPVTLDGSGSSDSDGSISSYEWLEGGSQIATGANPTVELDTGAHTITLTVTDDEGASGSDDVLITVEAANEAPVAEAGPDQTVTDSDDSGSEPVTLDGSGSSDSDGSISSYAWLEGGSQIATGVDPTVELDTGAHTITLTVTDDEGVTGSDDVVITVEAANEAPVAEAGPDQTVTDSDDSGSEPVTLDGSGSSDSDGSISSYAWLEGGSQIATGVDPTVELDTGAHTITLTVTDNEGATGSDNVVITVEAANQTPVADAWLNEKNKGIQVYSHLNNIYIVSESMIENARVTVYDMRGKKVWENTMELGKRNTIQLNQPIGFYIVEVVSTNQVEREKLFIE